MGLGYGFSGDAEAERRARRWFESSSPAVGVGARHHTVPAFCLRRFAGRDGRLLVRQRSTGKLIRQSLSDLAVTDFYTFMNTDGTFDGRLEQLLSQVEAEAAKLLRRLASPLRRPEAPSLDERSTICQFLAFQMVRGPRKRREIELMADYGMKVQAGELLSEKDVRQLTAVPHPNMHLQMLGPGAFEIHKSLLRRAVQIMWLDQPLLAICDEPVLVDVDDHVQHFPECFMTQAELRRRQKGQRADGKFSQTLHIWPTKPSGVEIAEAVAMPLSPSALLVLGPIGEDIEPSSALRGEEAADMAREVNAALAGQAYDWIAARPDHPSFASWTLPAPGPVIGVCDGGSTMSRALQSAPSHRWQRIRKEW